jgi:predicted acylesterase/phospholipase RssA
VDLLLSSGFLAFANHVGVLSVLERRGVAIDAVVGTSSGALVGALWAAGHDADRLEALVAGRRPFDLMGWHRQPWRGIFSLDPLLTWLRDHLPPTFADLDRPFAAGVAGARGAALLTEGPLPEAVAASCAIPGIFLPVSHGGALWRDGGTVDRLMVEPWRRWRGDRPAIAHLVDRTGGRDVAFAAEGLTVLRTARSGATFWSLGDVREAVERARRSAEAGLV